MLNNTWYIYSLSSPVFFSLCSPLCLWHSPHSPLFLSCLPAPTSIPLSLFLCAHITVVVTSHCVFLSLHDCSYPPPNTLLLPKAQPCPVTTLTSSLDTVLALTLSFHTVLLLPLDMGASNVNLDGHINGQTSTEYTHTPCLHKCQLYWLCCLPSWKTVSVIWPNDRVLEVARGRSPVAFHCSLPICPVTDSQWLMLLVLLDQPEGPALPSGRAPRSQAPLKRLWSWNNCVGLKTGILVGGMVW